MRLAVILAIILILIAGFLISQYGLPSGPATATNHTTPGIPELMPDGQELQQLGIAKQEECRTEEQTSIYSSMVQYGFCNYTIDGLNNTGVIIELKKFTNHDDLNGTYQYESSHLFGAKGLIGENDYGDQSRFRVNSDDDYGAQYNPPGIYFYHLWFTRGLYLVHITSGGSVGARDYIERAGRLMLSKF
jgi:hypothetical protein